MKNCKFRKLFVLVLTLLLAAVMLLNLPGCMAIFAEELTARMKPEGRSDTLPEGEDYSLASNSFGTELLKSVAASERTVNGDSTGNIMISPLSVMTALSMVALGAGGDTLAEFERVMGGIDVRMLSEYIGNSYAGGIKDKNFRLTFANSLWVNKNIGAVPRESFLHDNVNYFNAQIYRAPFNSRTVRDVNNWAAKNTDGKINNIIDRFLPDEVMLLANALFLDAKWQDPYEKTDVSRNTFTTYGGKEQRVDFMCSSEHCISDDGAKGMMKYYKYFSDNPKHSFVFAALLPDEGVDVFDYISGLNGERLRNIFTTADGLGMVKAYLPKFKFEYKTKLDKQLQELGIREAYLPSADFSAMSDEPLKLSTVTHKTFIEVDEIGTRAGAVSTAMSVQNGLAPVEELWLNRPFVFVIYDVSLEIPLFMGVVTNI